MSHSTIANFDLESDGLCILPRLISPEVCADARRRLDELFVDLSPSYAGSGSVEGGSVLADKSLERVVYNLHNKDDLFWTFFEHEEVLDYVGRALQTGSFNDSEPFYLNNISARCPEPGNEGQQLHLDANLPGQAPPLFVNVLWTLDEFSESNGTTRVVPGSHHWSRYPESGEHHEGEVFLSVPQGSAVIFDAALWHAGSSRPIEAVGTRWAIILGYSRWWIKPSFDTARNTSRELWESWTEQRRRLLGFDSLPPQDEFTRVRRRSPVSEPPVEG